MLCALDTSTEQTGLACYDASGLLAECTWLSERQHTTQVLPQLHMLLNHLRRTPADIQAVAVALGPGSWSGLRVGMSAAKGMALSGGLALLGIGTLDMLAYQHQHPSLPVYPLVRLGRERFATAKFASREGTDWQRVSDYSNISLDELAARIDSPALFCGDISFEVREQIEQRMGHQASFPAPVTNLRRPGYLAELAWKRFAAGERDNLSQLEPLYLGQPVKIAAG